MEDGFQAQDIHYRGSQFKTILYKPYGKTHCYHTREPLSSPDESHREMSKTALYCFISKCPALLKRVGFDIPAVSLLIVTHY